MVLLVEGDDAAPEDLLQGHLVGLQRGVEVDQGLLQIQQLNELLVALGLVQLPLHVVVGLVDLLQILQVALGHQQQDVEDKPGALLGAHVLDQAVLQVPHHRGLLQTDGDDVLFGDDDAHRQGGVHHAGLIPLHGGGVHDDEGLAVLAVNTGGLLLVQGGLQEGQLHPQDHRHRLQLVLAGVDEVDPAAVLHRIQLGHFSVNGLVNANHIGSHLSRAGKGVVCPRAASADIPCVTQARAHEDKKDARASPSIHTPQTYFPTSTRWVTCHGACHILSFLGKFFRASPCFAQSSIII